MLLYHRDGSAQAVVCAADSNGHLVLSQYTDTGPTISRLTLYHLAPGRADARVPMFKSLA